MSELNECLTGQLLIYISEGGFAYVEVLRQTNIGPPRSSDGVLRFVDQMNVEERLTRGVAGC